MPESDFQTHAPFLRLYVEHEPALRGYVRSLVPTLQDAQDVMQEVAAALWKRFHTLSAHEDFRRWAFGVARLESLEFLRKSRRDRHVFGDEFFNLLAAEAEDAADDLAAERRALDVCLQKLPGEQRTLVEKAVRTSVCACSSTTAIKRFQRICARMRARALSPCIGLTFVRGRSGGSLGER